MSSRRFQIAILIVAFLLSCTFALSAQRSQQDAPQHKRLILKDGSYQPASKWEVKGDRVRYWSTERSEWEEVPESMVDWAATEKWEKDRAAAAPPEDKEVEAISKEQKDMEDEAAAATPEVAPGVRLPSQGGVFLLDTYQKQQEIVEIVQNGSEVNKNTKSNILRAAINPIASAKQSFELKGAHAKIQAHTTQPALFIDIDNDTQAQPLPLQDNFRIVKVEDKKDMRVVGNLKVTVYGKVSQEQSFIPTKAEKVGDWVKITPTEPLAPGEYALVEMLSPREMNLYVWDFGVNQSAPENPGRWKPEPIKENPTGTDASPILTPGRKK